MGCLKLTYQEKEELIFFQGLWKKSDGPEKSYKYYPFGLQTSTSWTREETKNDYLYNAGSELNSTTGVYETFFRGYDATVGRFMQVDPYAAMMGSVSSYSYAFNNPVSLNDPMGAYPSAINPFDYGTGYVNNYPIGRGGGRDIDWASNYRDGQVNAAIMSASQFNNHYSTDFTSSQVSSVIRGEIIMGDSGYYEEFGVIDYSDGSAGIGNRFVAYDRTQGDGSGDTNAWGLFVNILDPAVNEGAKDALTLGTYTKGATNIARGAGATLTVVNAGLTYNTIRQEYNEGKIDTHSFVNGTVATLTTIAAGATLVLGAATAPVWLTAIGIGGAAYGIIYGIDQLSGGIIGIDQDIDNGTNHWGKQFNK